MQWKEEEEKYQIQFFLVFKENLINHLIKQLKKQKQIILIQKENIKRKFIIL